MKNKINWRKKKLNVKKRCAITLHHITVTCNVNSWREDSNYQSFLLWFLIAHAQNQVISTEHTSLFNGTRDNDSITKEREISRTDLICSKTWQRCLRHSIAYHTHKTRFVPKNQSFP